jgi:hypothetical protein
MQTPNGFRDRRIQPLCHPSEWRALKASGAQGGLRTRLGLSKAADAGCA